MCVGVSGRWGCTETQGGSSQRSWLDLATACRRATGQLPSTLAEYGGSCLATGTIELYGQEGGGKTGVVVVVVVVVQ